MDNINDKRIESYNFKQVGCYFHFINNIRKFLQKKMGFKIF